MKLRRISARTSVCAATLFLMSALVSACSVTPPSAVNPPATTSAATPAATSVSTTAPVETSEAGASTAVPTSDAMALPTLPPGRTPRQLETPITLPMTATRQPAATGQLPVLVFQWRGGIAGRNDLWSIYAGGTIRNNRDQQIIVAPETVTNLMRQLEQLGFYDLQDRYEPAGTCNDCFEYTIYAYRNGERKAIFAIDDGKLPEPLSQAVRAIQAVVLPQQ